MDRVTQIGFKNMLSLPVAKASKKVIFNLMDRARVTKEGKIVLHIKEGLDLILEHEDVYLILGVGMTGGKTKSKELPKGNGQSSNVNEEMFKLLKHASTECDTKKNKDKGDAGAVPGQDQDLDKDAGAAAKDKDAGAVPSQNKDARDVQGQPKKQKRFYFTLGCIRTLFDHKDEKIIKEGLDDEMAARLFCLEVLYKLLIVPGVSRIPTTIQNAVADLDKLKDVDWCRLVYEQLKKSITEWKNTSKNLRGCSYLLRIPFLDFIKSDDLGRTLHKIPRLHQYDNSMIKKLLGEKEFDNLEFRNLEETCCGHRETILAHLRVAEHQSISMEGIGEPAASSPYERRKEMKSMEGLAGTSSMNVDEHKENTKTGGTETASRENAEPGENAEAAGINLKDTGKEEQASNGERKTQPSNEPRRSTRERKNLLSGDFKDINNGNGKRMVDK